MRIVRLSVMQDFEMRKLAVFMLFLLLAILLNNSINHAIRKYGLKRIYCNQYPCERVAELKVKPRYVFVGSSTTRHGFDTAALQEALGAEEGEIILLATTPNNPEIALHLLEQYSPSFATDAIVLYGLDPWILSASYYRNFSALMSEWKPKERLAYIKSSGYDYNRSMHAINGGCVVTNLRNLIMKRKMAVHEFQAKPLDLILQDEHRTMPVRDIFGLDSFGWSERFLKSLAGIDELLSKQNRKLVVYTPAYTTGFIRDYDELGIHQQYQTSVKNSLKYGSVLAEMTPVPDSLYADMVHPGSPGKKANTERILEIISRYHPR